MYVGEKARVRSKKSSGHIFNQLSVSCNDFYTYLDKERKVLGYC